MVEREKRPLRRPWCRWENNINMHFASDGRAWTDMAEGRDK